MFLLVNKPKGITSHDVIDQIRRVTGIRKVGHAGTLDPAAVGLLIVAVGRDSTKNLGDLTTKTQKKYEGTVVLGEKKDSDDEQGRTIATNEQIIPTKDEVLKVISEFNGEIEQFPPSYSAIKVGGKKSYEEARKGKTLKLPKRKVTIHEISLIDYSHPEIKISTTVSSGTYIRSLARDIGERLGTYGYLKNLKRTQIGNYKLSNAVELDKLTEDNWRDYSI